MTETEGGPAGSPHKDGGNISLKSAINNPENGLPTELFNSLTKAVNTGFISEDDLRWDEAITKSDAIQLLLDAVNTYYYNLNNPPVEDSNTNNVEEQESDLAPVTDEDLALIEEHKNITNPVKNNTDKDKNTDKGASNSNQTVSYNPEKFPSFGDKDRIPCPVPEREQEIQANRATFEKYYNEDAYGTLLKGKGDYDLPHVGFTDYSMGILEEVRTNKGYLVMRDTLNGRVYYSGMMLPNGTGFIDWDSDTVLIQYQIDNNYFSVYDITYAERQQLLGTYDGN